MKHKISISLEGETILKIMDAVRTKHYRNRSHVIECVLNEVLQ